MIYEKYAEVAEWLKFAGCNNSIGFLPDAKHLNAEDKSAAPDIVSETAWSHV